MHVAAFKYYGLLVNYTRTFKLIPLTDKATGAPLLDKNGKQKTALRSCNIVQESKQGNAVWVQVNEPFPGTALTGNEESERRYPKKARNNDIRIIRNITLDTEHPPAPDIALTIGHKLVDYLIATGLVESDHPIENSGAGPHIVLPIVPIETTPETAELWNTAVARVVKTHIKPEFDRLCKEAGVRMDLGGFDISRVLSPPGTWRPRNPNKDDCETLHQGVLRQWLPPYVDGNYPIRKESTKLTLLIREAFNQLQEEAQRAKDSPRPARKGAQKAGIDPAQWLRDYAVRHPNEDRSAHFQTLVNATYLNYGEDTVFALKEDINSFSGEKYNGRLDEELSRSLEVARQTAYRKNDDIGIPDAPSIASGQRPQSYNLTDLGNAERFAAKYRDKVRWCETWNTWLIFNGKCWEPDRTGRVDQFGKVVVRLIYNEAAAEPEDDQRKRIAKHANASESNRAVRAMLDRAKSELPAVPDDFNKHLYLLNCNNGTLDLRSGELRSHNPHDMLTRCLKIDYNPLAPFGRWESFIKSIFAEDSDLIQFMKEALGMSLCGDISEQCLFICHGNGSNGKTTMLETIRIIMRDYALAANVQTFQMRKNEGIGNDIAELYGARFVTASENALGSRLNEALIKKATGKEPLRGRRLHENEFEFMPEFTLWFAVNHKPIVRDTSKGMWRRVHFIPFSVTIEGDKVDKHLGEKLLEEAEGILAWLVQGCVAWFKRGHLEAPRIVQEATQAYRSEMDIIANFVDEECLIGDGKTVSTKLLLERFESWCNDNGEKYDPRTLRNALRERGLHSTKSTGGRYYWQGIGIIDSGPSGPSGPKNEVILRGENTSQKTLNSGPPTSTTSTSELEFENESGGTSTQESDGSGNVLDEHQQLFAQYQASIPISSAIPPFWNVPGSGYPNGPLPPSEHIARMRALLQSGNREKVNAAVDGIKKRLGLE